MPESDSTAMQTPPADHEPIQGSGSDPPPPMSQDGLVLEVNFGWLQFRNTISERDGNSLVPRYVQHFKPSKPQLRFNSADDKTQIGFGTVNHVSITGECTVDGHKIELKPLKRWATKYNYLSHAFAAQSDPATPVPITWTGIGGFKIWSFVCLDANQLPIAKFSANVWAWKSVGKIQFEKKEDELSEEQKNEVVVTGLTVFYMMTTRINNPFSLIGSAFAKPGPVEERKGL